MKGAQLTIYRRALKWLRYWYCDVEMRNLPIDFSIFIRMVDGDDDWDEMDLIAVYERLHDEGILEVCK